MAFNNCTALAELFPDEVDWYNLSFRLPMDCIKKNLDRDISWYGVSVNKEITWGDVVANPTLSWDYFGLSQNQNINIEIVLEEVRKDLMKFLNDNDGDPDMDLERFFHSRWDWFSISRNSHTTLKHVKTHHHLPWSYKGLSYNPNVTFENVLDNLHESWDWFGVSKHNNVKMEHVIANPTLPWNGGGLSVNPNIVWEHVCMHPNLDWDLSLIVLSLDVPLSSVPEKYIPQYWVRMSRTCSFDYIVSHPSFPWNWYSVSLSERVTWTDITEHPDLPWDRLGVSMNRNLTWIDVARNMKSDKPFPWDWNALSMNKFDRWGAAIKIQRFWRKAIYYKRKRAHKKLYQYVMTELNMNPHNNFGYEFRKLKKKVDKLAKEFESNRSST